MSSTKGSETSLTSGLFYLVINAAMLGLTAALSDRLQVAGIGTAIVAGAVLALVSWVFDLLFDR